MEFSKCLILKVQSMSQNLLRCTDNAGAVVQPIFQIIDLSRNHGLSISIDIIFSLLRLNAAADPQLHSGSHY